MRGLTYFFQLHFIFELLSIFMVMINFVKIELNWKMPAKCFFCYIFFTKGIIPYLSHSHLVKIKGFKYNTDNYIVIF